MPDIGVFSLENSRVIADVVRKIRNKPQTGRRPTGRNNQRARQWPVKFQAPSGGIPGRMGTTPGSAVCDVVYGVESSGTVTLTPDGNTITVYNWAVSAVCDTGDRYGLAELHADLLYWVEAEDCSDDPGAAQPFAEF